MSNLPQNITDRYVNNLLRNGVNNDFRLFGITIHSSFVGDHLVGWYFKAVIQLQRNELPSFEAYGATPNEALSRALLAAGVTYATS